MPNTTQRFATATNTLLVADLETYSHGWILDGQYRYLSPATLGARRDLITKLLWFLRSHDHATCGLPELRAFLAYLSTGHTDEGGRWGRGHDTQVHQALKPVCARTVRTYHGNLRTLFRFLVAEGALTEDPMERLRPPVSRDDQIQPFTPEQVRALLAAAKKGRYGKRNEAILMFLHDTGARASEVCGVQIRDLDLTGKRCLVTGKGDKQRVVYIGAETARALWAYLKTRPHHAEDEALFQSERGPENGSPLTRYGLLRLVRVLGKAAGLQATRCSPHTFRHTFAVSFLRNGGNVYTLKTLLGHESLAMTNRYVALAQADLEAQHRQFSPTDRLLRRRR
jgi:site-specific recombinase XerD